MTVFNGLQFPIKIVQGDDWNFPIIISTRLDGVKTPVDLTEATIVGRVRPLVDSGTVTNMGVEITDAPAGEVVLSLTDAQTSSLAAASLQYQVTVTINNITTTYLRGNFIVQSKVQPT